MHKLIRIVYGVLKSGKPFDQTKLTLPNVVLEEETDFLLVSLFIRAGRKGYEKV